MQILSCKGIIMIINILHLQSDISRLNHVNRWNCVTLNNFSANNLQHLVESIHCNHKTIHLNLVILYNC